MMGSSRGAFGGRMKKSWTLLRWQKRRMGFAPKMKLKSKQGKRKIESVDRNQNCVEIGCVDGNQIVSSPILRKHGKKIKTSNLSINGSVIVNKNSSMSKSKKAKIDKLPEEVLSVILVTLPLKYLLRCLSVQKSWYSLVRSSNFIALHLNYQKKKMIPKYLFFRNEFTCEFTIRFDDKQCEEYCYARQPPDLPLPVWFAQSYGLICLTSMYDSAFVYEPKFYLWNPLIQKYITLPKSPLPSFPYFDAWTALAFGFVPQVNDFLVVHIVKPPPVHSKSYTHSVIIGVYSLNNNSWRITSQDNVFFNEIWTHHHVFVNGVAFWLGIKQRRRRHIIMCFDTNTNILREISLPQWVRTQRDLPNKIIHPFGQSIAYFVENKKMKHVDMWVLKGDPINEFYWEKKMNVSLSEDIRPEVLGLRNNGEPILFNLSKLISYNLDTHEANDFVHSWAHRDLFYSYVEELAPPFGITPFVESLVLLDSKNQQEEAC